MKSVLNEYVFQINQLQVIITSIYLLYLYIYISIYLYIYLQAKIESLHREKTLLQHQSIEMERHHQQIRDELHTERDYLRKLVEQQLKGKYI